MQRNIKSFPCHDLRNTRAFHLHIMKLKKMYISTYISACEINNLVSEIRGIKITTKIWDQPLQGIPCIYNLELD
jgi:hypothetical protein